MTNRFFFDRNRADVLPFVVVILLLTCFTVGVLLGKWKDVKKERVRDLKNTHTVIKSYYEFSFHQWQNTLLNLGERLVSIRSSDSLIVRQKIINDAILNHPELLAFGYASPNGQILVATGGAPGDTLPNLLESSNSRRSFEHAKSVKTVSIGESYYLPYADDWVLPVRVPLLDSKGRVLAVSVTAIRHINLVEILKSFHFNKKYQVQLINETFNTTQLYFPLAESEYKNVLAKSSNIFENTDSGYIDRIHFKYATNRLGGQENMVIKSSMEGLEHSLIISMPTEVLWNEFSGFFQTTIGLFIFLLVSLCFLFAVSEKKRKDYLSDLSQREANLNALIGSTNSLIGLFNTDKTLIEFNSAFKKSIWMMEGIDLESGMDILAKFKDQGIADLFRKYLDRALTGEKFSETMEYSGDGITRCFLLRYNPIFERDSITGTSFFAENITALKASERELEKYTKNLQSLVSERTQELENANNELKERNQSLADALSNLKIAQGRLIQSEKLASLGGLSAGIGHEINNPLNYIKNGIMALSECLEKNQKPDQEEIRKFESAIIEGTERISKIVASLGNFTRDDKKQKDSCDIHEIIDHCLIIMEGKLKARVEIVKKYGPKNATIVGSRGRIHQVFLNLLTNAEQSIDEHGTIEIETTEDDSQIKISIADNGVGISSKVLEKISEPFFTTKSPGSGMGLGLFITNSIIQEHNGELTIDSKDGFGTKCMINFEKG